MNYMEEVAKMLGVKMGEEFSVVNDTGLAADRYKLTRQGLIYSDNENPADLTLFRLLTGEYTIKKKPWKPKKKERYYLAAPDGSVDYEYWSEDWIDMPHYIQSLTATVQRKKPKPTPRNGKRSLQVMNRLMRWEA